MLSSLRWAVSRRPEVQLLEDCPGLPQGRDRCTGAPGRLHPPRLPGTHCESHRLAPLGFLLNQAAGLHQDFVFSSLARDVFCCGEARACAGKINFGFGIGWHWPPTHSISRRSKRGSRLSRRCTTVAATATSVLARLQPPGHENQADRPAISGTDVIVSAGFFRLARVRRSNYSVCAW